MEKITLNLTRDERDWLVMMLLFVATHGDTAASERLEILDMIEVLMKGQAHGA
jgi:hypothetical protein